MIATHRVARDKTVIGLVNSIRRAVDPVTIQRLATWSSQIAYQRQRGLRRLNQQAPGYAEAIIDYQRWDSAAKVFGALSDLEGLADIPFEDEDNKGRS